MGVVGSAGSEAPRKDAEVGELRGYRWVQDTLPLGSSEKNRRELVAESRFRGARGWGGAGWRRCLTAPLRVP